MIYRKQFLVLMFPIYLLGCQNPLENNTSETTADAANSWNWTEVQLEQVILNARRGDIEAARSLYDYYSAHADNVNIEIWEAWLIQRQDLDALGTRATRRFSAAANLDDDDPQKLFLLKEADLLQTQALTASHTAKGQSDTRSGNPTELAEYRNDQRVFSDKIKQEILRVSVHKTRQ